jgi:hypothetical protein
LRPGEVAASGGRTVSASIRITLALRPDFRASEVIPGSCLHAGFLIETVPPSVLPSPRSSPAGLRRSPSRCLARPLWLDRSTPPSISPQQTDKLPLDGPHHSHPLYELWPHTVSRSPMSNVPVTKPSRLAKSLKNFETRRTSLSKSSRINQAFAIMSSHGRIRGAPQEGESPHETGTQSLRGLLCTGDGRAAE